MSAGRQDTELSPLKRALIALDRMQAKLDAADAARREPVAIVGIGCRFPKGADTPERFWELLRDGVDGISEVPPDRWDIDAYYDRNPDRAGKMSTRWGGFLEAVDQFDPQFFGITPREAQSLDPQQRLLLETTWEALEHAGQAPDRLAGTRTGVFVGILSSDYGDLQLKGDGIDRIDAYFGSGTARSLASGRISYLLGLEGPSVSIDTACSSSLVAVHLACQSLRAGEVGMALAAGVNLTLAPEPTVALSRFHMMAADGRCKTFDAAADGYVRGEGCGVLVLKRLSDAVANGDRVLALISGSAVNQDGASSGLTAPNGPAQERVILDALASAGVRPAQMTYVEAHGTGTSLGDPIEVQALANALGAGRPPDRPVLMGTVKTNIGHTEAAAGIAGLIKVVLALQHKAIPSNLHFHTPNPHIPWERLPVRVPTALTPWPADAPLVAGVSSFGFSGTNAHIVLQAGPASAQTDVASQLPDRPVHVLTLSAGTETALAEQARRMADLFDGSAERISDVCFTANAGRAQRANRVAVVESTAEQMRTRLRAFAAGEQAPGVFAGRPAPGSRQQLAMLFTGQGAQRAGMGRELYANEPVFKRALDDCDERLRSQLDVPLLSVLYGADTGLIDQTRFAQPALFAVEYALAQLWFSWGIRPSALMGHSIGEYVAAHLAGVFSLEDALMLVAERGRLMQSLPAGGQMAAVMAGLEAVEAAVGAEGVVDIAAVNGPESVVISGAGPAIERVVARLGATGVQSRRLAVSHAFHSALMDPILDAFEAFAAKVTFHAPTMRVVSNLTGELASPDELRSAAYWRRHLRAPVRFSAGIQALHAQGFRLFLEAGPTPTLATMGQRCVPAGAATFLASLRGDAAESAQMARTVAQLFVDGVAVDWTAFDAGRGRRRVTLPASTFERTRHWMEPRRESAARPVAAQVHALLGRRIPSALEPVQFEQTLRMDSFPFIADHRVQGVPILPATAYIESIVAAAAFVAPQAAILDLALIEAMPFSGSEPRVVQTVVEPSGSDASVRVFSCDGRVAQEARPGWRLHATATLRCSTADDVASPPSIAVAAIQARCAGTADREAHYSELHRRGFLFGPSLRCVERVWFGPDEALAEVALPEAARVAEDFTFPPALLDSCLQFCWSVLPQQTDGTTYLPHRFARIEVHGRPGERVWSHVRVRPADSAGGERIIDAAVYGPDGRLVAELQGVVFRKVATQALSRMLGVRAGEDWLYEMAWRTKELAFSADRPVLDQGHTTVLSPGAIAADVDPLLDPLSEEHGLPRQRALVKELDTLSYWYLLVAFESLGIRFRPGQPVTVEAVSRQAGVLPKYGRLVARLFEILGEEGVLARAPGGWTCVRAPQVPGDPAAFWNRLSAEHPLTGAQLELTRRCGERLAGVLVGKVDPLSLLFPGGSLEIAERLYREIPEARVYNALVAKAIAAAVASRPADRPLRVFEVGAGTGGVTSYVLPVLPADTAEYWFTDLSPVFLAKAKQKFRDFPFVKYGLYNADFEPKAQGVAAGAYDIVISVNALHATADLRKTMSGVRQLLAPGGLLVLLEGTGPDRWVDITFGLTDGWWGFKDTDLRPAYPLLSRPSWIDLLRDVGFADVAISPRQTDLSRQAVVIAKNATGSEEHGGYVLVGDTGHIGKQLAARLEARGERVHLIADADAAAGSDHLARAMRSAGRVSKVVYVGTGVVDGPSLDPVTSLEPIERRICGGLLDLVKAVVAVGGDNPPALRVVTRGAQATGRETGITPVQATLLGFCKVVDLEHPELRSVRIDLDPDKAVDDQLDLLVADVCAGDAENQVAYRNGQREALRLVRSAIRSDEPAAAEPDADAMLLEAAPSGVLDDLRWSPVSRRAPGPGEVEVDVRASGVSFRDVMNAVAMRRDRDPLGSECAGVVASVGMGVTEFLPGDAVVVLATGGLASHVVAPVELVVRKPAHLSFEEAVTLPTTAVTALHALQNLARLRAGESVLIHAAAGGVGLAAVQIARRIGARVYATAGSEVKRAFLRALGVERVFSSRTLDFADQVLAATAGRGVDVTLNALSGEFIAASVAATAPDGRFVEIGKRDIWSQARMAAEKPGITYHIVDLASGGTESRQTVGSVFRQMMALAERGDLRPLPMRLFDRKDVAAAFRHVAQARHVGKVVVRPAPRQPSLFREDASYLISGGLAGLGLLTAEWMVEQGARHLLLFARREPHEAARAAIARMEAAGASVLVGRGDVADAAFLRGFIARAGRDVPPLRGVIHSAGLLEDGVLMRQNWERFARVMAPKVDGAWNLHALTLGHSLDFFVLYSSVAGVMGAAAQANHAAANTFMDALAHQRRACGWPALSINWGVWSDIGSAAERETGKRVSRQGVSTIAPNEGLRALETVLRHPGAQIAVLPIDWPVYVKQFNGGVPAWLSEVATVRTSVVAPPSAQSAPAASAGTSLLDDLEQVPASKHREFVEKHVAAQVAAVIGLDRTRALDPDQALTDIGLDSLMAVELRNRLSGGLGADRMLPATLVFDYPSISAIASYLLSSVLESAGPPAETPVHGAGEASTPDRDVLSEIEQLSDEDAEQLSSRQV